MSVDQRLVDHKARQGGEQQREGDGSVFAKGKGKGGATLGVAYLLNTAKRRHHQISRDHEKALDHDVAPCEKDAKVIKKNDQGKKKFYVIDGARSFHK